MSRTGSNRVKKVLHVPPRAFPKRESLAKACGFTGQEVCLFWIHVFGEHAVRRVTFSGRARIEMAPGPGLRQPCGWGDHQDPTSWNMSGVFFFPALPHRPAKRSRRCANQQLRLQSLRKQKQPYRPWISAKQSAPLGLRKARPGEEAAQPRGAPCWRSSNRRWALPAAQGDGKARARLWGPGAQGRRLARALGSVEGTATKCQLRRENSLSSCWVSHRECLFIAHFP